MTVIDAIREVKPPFSPESVVSEFANVLNRYRITKVTGDRYAGAWPADQFAKHRITYEPSETVKSDLYLNLLPAINSRSVSLLDNDRLTGQLVALERHAGFGARDRIDHPRGRDAHDDVANAVAGAVQMTVRRRYNGYDVTGSWMATDDDFRRYSIGIEG